MLAGLRHRDKNGEGRRICASDLMHVTHPLWLAEQCPRKWWGRRVLPSLPLACQTSALLMSYVPRKLERVNGVAPAFAYELRRAGRHPEMPFCECVVRPAFQVLLEILGLFNRLERNVELELPRREFGRVRTLPGVMVRHPLAKVPRMADVALIATDQALDDVRIEHIMACHP